MSIIITMVLPLIMAAFFGLIFRGNTGNGALTAQDYIPGMLGLAILWLGVFGVGPPLVQWREQQILRRLGATPLPRVTLLLAQIAWRLTTVVLQATILVAYGMIAYHMSVHDWPILIVTALLGGAMFIALGFLMAAVSRSQESVVALGQVIQFPMMFLSGTLFPVAMLPAFVRPIVDVMPLTYLGDALRQAMLGSAPLYPLWLDLTVLGGCLIVFSGLSVRLFRWG